MWESRTAAFAGHRYVSGFNGCFTSLSACKMFSGQSLIYGRFTFWSKQELSDIKVQELLLHSINISV